jgi:hypothetical protein
MSSASAESDWYQGTKTMKQNTQTKGLLGDIWKILGGGHSNTGAGG